MRTIVVGDIHGCIDEFKELMRLVSFKPSVDRLVLLGDLIDRGPDSVGVVRMARELRAESVLGNHEDWYLRFRRRELEVRNGTRAKNEMRSTPAKLQIAASLDEDDWVYFKRMPLWIDLEGIKAVHAGFEPCFSIQDQRADKVVRLVYVDTNGKTAKTVKSSFVNAEGKTIEVEDHRKKPPGSKRWAEMFDRFDTIYGHAVFSFTDPVVDCTGEAVHYGIDTGCYAGGRLTAWVRAHGGSPEIVQVQAKTSYGHRELAEL